MKNFSERLKSALEDASLRQSDLAKACDVSAAAVSDWIHGKTKYMRPANLVAAAKLLGVRIEWLATGEPPRRDRPMNKREREILELLRAMDDERTEETLKFARYARTISWPTEDPEKSRQR